MQNESVVYSLYYGPGLIL